MGQKTHPVGFRLGVIRSWNSKWYEEKNYVQWLHEDLKLRGIEQYVQQIKETADKLLRDQANRGDNRGDQQEQDNEET